MKYSMLLLLALVSCGKSGGGSSSPSEVVNEDVPETREINLFSLSSLISSGTANLAIIGDCTIEESCTVSGLFYAVGLTTQKMNYSADLEWNGTDYVGIIIDNQGSCGWIYTLTISSDFQQATVDVGPETSTIVLEEGNGTYQSYNTAHSSGVPIGCPRWF